MKRLLVLAFVAVVVATWVLPSYAEVTFGGQYRVRAEYRDNSDFTDDSSAPDSTDNESYYGQRTRLWGIAKPTEDVTVKITLQDTRYWGEYTNAAGGPELTAFNASSSSSSSSSTSCAPHDTTEIPPIGPFPGGSVVTDPTHSCATSTSTSTSTKSSAVDLHEAYVQIDKFFGTPFDIRVGTQELVYGDQRLIGNFNWSNYGRSFDAIKLMYKSENFDTDIWTAKIDENFNKDSDQDFYGVYTTVKAIPNNVVDLYLLLLRDGSTTPLTVNNTMASGIDETQTLYTGGVRVAGTLNAIDYGAEMAMQMGDMNTMSVDYDVDALAFAMKAGYTFANVKNLRVGFEYNFASGDDDPSDSDIETFSNLFPTNHPHMGYMDQQAWRNMEAYSFNATIEPTDKLKLYAALWNFSVDESADHWYAAGNWMNAPTATVRTASSSLDEDDLGNEIDLVATYKYNKAVTLEAGLGVFFPDDFIEMRTQAYGYSDDEQDWAYLMLTANF